MEIYVMEADGSNQVDLTEYPNNDWYPTWSPDGSKVAFTSFRDGDHEIYVMNGDGSNQVNLSNNPADDRDPAWSPDGSELQFSGAGGRAWPSQARMADPQRTPADSGMVAAPEPVGNIVDGFQLVHYGHSQVDDGRMQQLLQDWSAIRQYVTEQQQSQSRG